ncbi:NUDIX hydrolase [Priestia megaterium]|uniref:NUDIX hydrolase n=1 Tax=Priestia megaterium TaxID=1404 RepID=UPI001A951267|nr:NUDIX hydrolase [Priestia megaterium]QSX24538.1 NUDIX hydrolase [Priestia megaterium]
MDIVFTKENQRFNYRVAAVCIEVEHILLNKGKGEDHWFLPGGRVQMMESGEEALKRELKEEIGAEIKIDSLLWIVENFFNYDNHNFHEIGLYYKGTLEGNSFIEKGTNPFVIKDYDKEFMFQWISLEQIIHMNVQPEFLKNRLVDIPIHTEHLVVR